MLCDKTKVVSALLNDGLGQGRGGGWEMIFFQLPAVLHFSAFAARVLGIINILELTGKVTAQCFSKA